MHGGATAAAVAPAATLRCVLASLSRRFPHQNAVGLTAEFLCLQDPGGVMGADKSWDEMSSEERQAVRLLGWTAESWADDAYEPYAAPSAAEILASMRSCVGLTVVRWRLGSTGRGTS